MLTRLIPRRRPVTDVSEADLYLNPYPYYRRLRSELPVAYAPALRHHALQPDAYWLVTRWDDVVTVLKDDETFRSPEPPPDLPPTVGESLLYANAEEHTRYRAALRKLDYLQWARSAFLGRAIHNTTWQQQLLDLAASA